MALDLDRLLRRGVAEIIVEEELRAKLAAGRPLRLKLGFDPSKPDLHVGHAVVLRKIRQFQDLGHQVVLIVGDWTAQIGDPSGRDVSRQMLTPEEVRENAQTYMDQFFLIVDRQRTEVRWQTEWFGSFTLADVFRLTSRFTLAQMMQHETFRKRYEEGRALSLMELLYPLLQAYDSVAVQADVEFGGTDQKFNILAGRELQLSLGLSPQDVFLCPLLIGTDGRKMSKSYGNTIDLTTPPNDMYGRIMSIADAVMMDYFELLTDVPDAELEAMREALARGEAHPMELKKRLAREIVAWLHGAAAAEAAQAEFERIFQKRQAPSEVPIFRLKQETPWAELLVQAGLVPSKSEARRLIRQRAVVLDGRPILDAAASAEQGLLQVGRRRFLRIETE
ncbi:MAG: tyrosine--tRNA ligase [Chloroflexia bacterium]